jgi:predicted RND superfamily exporter protein
MLIGLAAKNAILIVEFAKMELDAGKPLMEATMTAAKLRFRPILMTAFAFILGVVPLLTASGAGAEGRKVIGVSVFAGMLIATFLGVLLIPMLFVMVERIVGSAKHHETPAVASVVPPAVFSAAVPPSVRITSGPRCRRRRHTALSKARPRLSRLRTCPGSRCSTIRRSRR